MPFIPVIDGVQVRGAGVILITRQTCHVPAAATISDKEAEAPGAHRMGPLLTLTASPAPKSGPGLLPQPRSVRVKGGAAKARTFSFKL